MTLILGISTSSPALSLALFDKGVCVGHLHEVIGRGHAERLIPAIKTLIAGRTAEALVVDIGPGSFTGIRVGLAAAHALGLAWHAPVTGVMASILVAAAGFAAAEAAGQPVPGLTVALDAGRGQFFCQRIDRGFAATATQTLAPDDIPRAPRDGLADYGPDMASLLLVPAELRALSPHAHYVRPPDAKLPL